MCGLVLTKSVFDWHCIHHQIQVTLINCDIIINSHINMVDIVTIIAEVLGLVHLIAITSAMPTAAALTVESLRGGRFLPSE